MNHKKRYISIATVTAFLLLLLLTVLSDSSHSQFVFDPKSVQPENSKEGDYNLGYNPISQAQKDKLSWSVPVVRGLTKIPSRYDLSSKMPPIGNQGRQGSCVGWASTYGIKSYHEMRKNNWSYGKHPQRGGSGDHVFSPAFTYNQINGGRDKGSNPANALSLLRRNGAVPWLIMPYTDRDYRRQPSGRVRSAAGKYRIREYRYLQLYDTESTKVEIASGNPVLAGVKIYSNFYRLGGKVYDQGEGSFRGGHAIVFVGYDDNKVSPLGHRGAFKIFNSWGTGWGRGGYGWVSYKAYAGGLGLGSFAVHDSRQRKSIPDESHKKGRVKAPHSVTATKGTYSDRVVVSWSRVNGAAAYRVERSVGNSKSFSYLGNAYGAQYDDFAIQPDLNFKYRIITVTGKGRSRAADSPVAEGFALAKKNKLPSKVIGFKGEVSASGKKPKIILRWQKASGAKKYKLVRWDEKRGKWRAIYKGSSLRYTDSKPLKKTNYYYVRGLNRSGVGEWSIKLEFNISSTSGPPSDVTGVTASNTFNDRIVIKWSRVPSANKYGIYRWNYSLSKWDKYFTTGSTKFADKTRTILNGREFMYTVKAINSSGSSANWSRRVKGFTRQISRRFMVQSALKIDPPKKIRRKISEKRGIIKISWEKVRGAEKYNIYRKKEGDMNYSLAGSVPGSRKSYSEKIPGNSGEIYLYTVRSSGKAEGESADSETVAGFVNIFTPLVMTTFVPGEGIKNFKGRWNALYWEPGRKPVKVEISISGSGKNYGIDIKYGEAGKKRFSGTYASKSRFLETKDIRFELLEKFDNDIARVLIEPGKLMPGKVDLNFTREKKK